MVTHVLIPVKSLTNAKSRLAPYMTREARKKLSLEMLTHVITILKKCEEITQITVVTPDPLVGNFVTTLGVSYLKEEMPGYNPAVQRAAEYEKENELLTIASDLPLVTVSDIHHLLELGQDHDVVLAPAKDGGTNAVFMKPAGILPYLFGENSFEAYLQSAKAKKMSVSVYRSKTIALDIDTITDLKEVKKMQEKPQSNL